MIMLAAAGGMAALGAINSMQQSKAQAAAERIQYNDAMRKQSIQAGVQMFNTAQANVMRDMANRNIAKASLENYVNNSNALSESYQTNMGNVARQVQLSNQSITRRAANKLGRDSGTYKLMKDKMEEAGAAEFTQSLRNKQKAELDLQKQHQNNLNQRDLFSYGVTATNVPGVPPMEPNHTAAAIMGGLQGAMQGAAMGQSLSQGVGQLQNMFGAQPGAWTGFVPGGS